MHFHNESTVNQWLVSHHFRESKWLIFVYLFFQSSDFHWTKSAEIHLSSFYIYFFLAVVLHAFMLVHFKGKEASLAPWSWPLLWTNTCEEQQRISAQKENPGAYSDEALSKNWIIFYPSTGLSNTWPLGHQKSKANKKESQAEDARSLTKLQRTFPKKDTE